MSEPQQQAKPGPKSSLIMSTTTVKTSTTSRKRQSKGTQSPERITRIVDITDSGDELVETINVHQPSDYTTIVETIETTNDNSASTTGGDIAFSTPPRREQSPRRAVTSISYTTVPSSPRQPSPTKSQLVQSPRSPPHHTYTTTTTTTSNLNTSALNSSILNSSTLNSSTLNSSTLNSSTNIFSTNLSTLATPIATPSKRPGIPQTPSVVKNETRTLIKKLDATIDDLKAAEELYALCLFQANRANILDTGIIPALALALKTKNNRIKEICARILQLFAQDGGEPCIQMKRLNMCNSLMELLTKTDDINVQIPVVGLIYWLVQNPPCKKEFLDMGADTYLREINNRTKDPMLTKYLNYALNCLNTKVKSREEMLLDVLSVPVETPVTTVQNISHDFNQSFSAYATPSPRHFFGLFKTPAPPSAHSTTTTTITETTRKVDFRSPAKVTVRKTEEIVLDE
jgi:hypothetical protein